jgi:hypothetical protein
MASWRARLRLGEAMVFLIVARFLVNRVRLQMWSGLLGPPQGLEEAASECARQASGDARRIGAGVERAAWRLGGAFKCLPKAICAHWMLRRRGFASRIVFAARPRQARGSPGDLHAWTEVKGGIVIGESTESFVPFSVFGTQF